MVSTVNEHIARSILKAARCGKGDRLTRFRVFITGNVQGVGLRPFVWKLAHAHNLSGWVRNESAGVSMEVQGTDRQLDSFLQGLRERLPPSARIDSLQAVQITPASDNGFVILDSRRQTNVSTSVPADLCVCQQCMDEFSNHQDRRHRYPFINCTNCGPRFTIIEGIPYDRRLTTMKRFRMCQACEDEYHDPSSRRFHAQPNACSDCGPRVWFVTRDAEATAFQAWGDGDPIDELAIESFHDAIANGRVGAVKGIGGFHLVCDATSRLAVETLRARKGRIDKPFALMVADVEVARSFARISDGEQQLLQSPERPIVLLRKRLGCPWQAMLDAVAPLNDMVGVMLPYSPLHHLLIEPRTPLVMTSGNLSDEPIARNNQEARERLGSLVDFFLLHNREIHIACDDSVVQSLSVPSSTVTHSNYQAVSIRRSRGYAPLSVALKEGGAGVLAVGGEIKSVFCLGVDRNAYLSQHIGDLGSLETAMALRRSVDHFLGLFSTEVMAIAADLHPGYLSNQFAKELADEFKIPWVGVQHHFAHAASLMAEAGWPLDQRLIACCFDGTGYGADGAIWGGEFLVANCQAFQRRAQLSYFPMIGGDVGVQKPYRMALSQLWQSGFDWDERLPCVSACPPGERVVLRQQLVQPADVLLTSSMGRLFDAIASLVGTRHRVTYEAQAAIELETLARGWIDDVDPLAYSFDIQPAETIQIDPRRLIQMIGEDVIKGVAREVIAAQFHHAVARMVGDVCQLIRDETGLGTVALTGGVFQNTLLLTLVREQLFGKDFDAMVHHEVPCNDGGLALGQMVIARNRLDDGSLS